MQWSQLEEECPGTGTGGQHDPAPEPYEIILEFSRAESADDPYSFQFKEQEYRLRVGNGEARSAVFPWNEPLLADLRALSQQQADAEVARRLGERLGRFLDALDWGGHEHAVDDEGRARRELRVVIRSAAAELYALPWELVTLKGCGQHLAQVPGCSLSYEWPMKPQEPPRTRAPQRGRVLFAWSIEGGRVPADAHLRALRQATQEADFAFDVEHDVLPGVSLGALKKRLEDTSRGPISVLHVLCHGAPLGAQGASYGLSWNKSQTNDDKALVDGGMLAAVLAPHAATLRMVVLCACHSGDGGAMARHLGGVAQELHRAGIEMVVASRLPLSSLGSTLLTETLYQKLMVDSCSLEEALAEARGRLRMEGNGYDWASLQLYARRSPGADLRPVTLRPYRGLLPFEPGHRRFFFGREKLTAELLTRVQQAARGQRPRFQVVVGASGAGKSSLVMAGLVPRLPEDGWDRLVVRPGQLVCTGSHASPEHPTALQELWNRLHRFWAGEKPPFNEGAGGERGDEGASPRQEYSGRKLLLVMDQLEEVFTQLREPERAELLAGVWALTRKPGLDCVVVATMRVDYFERCAEVALDEQTWLDAVVSAEEHRLFVAHMGPEELTAAIEKPARRVGLTLEQGLAARLRRYAEHAPGTLPLLALTLDLLWQRREGRWLTHAAYEHLGAQEGALTQTAAERLYEDLSAAERRQARRLLVRLGAAHGLARSGAQGCVWVEELQPQQEAERKIFEGALEKLVKGRLLVMGGAEQGMACRGRRWVQLAHAMLLRHWKRLEQWMAEDWEREQELRGLETWAEDWENHLERADRGASFLLVGDRLGYARSLREKHGAELSPRSQRLLAASVAAEIRTWEEELARRERENETLRALAQAQARVARFFRVGFAVAVLLVGAMGTLIVFARLQQRENDVRKMAMTTLQLLLGDGERSADSPG